MLKNNQITNPNIL